MAALRRKRGRMMGVEEQQEEPKVTERSTTVRLRLNTSVRLLRVMVLA